MAKINPKVRKITLKPQIDSDVAEEMVDNKKVKLFQTLLKKPKKSEIHLHSLKLFYEACLLLSGKYTADFIRDANHTIHVDKNVRELIIDDKVYPVSQKKSVLSKLEPTRKNKIKVEFQERLIIENGFKSGLLLPQVPIEYNWSEEQFLNHTCHKAGLTNGSWKDIATKISKFQGIIFKEILPNGEIIQEKFQ